MKKFLAILLAVGVLSVFAAGCSGGDAAKTDAPAPGAEGTPKPEGETKTTE